MSDPFIELLKLLPTTHIDRLLRDQKVARVHEKPLPEVNAKAQPASSQPMGAYRGNIYA